MSPSQIIKLSIGGLILYLMCGIVAIAYQDKIRALMFLGGAVLWIIGILIWSKNKND